MRPAGLTRRERRAGNIPNAIAVAMDKPALKASTGKLTFTSSKRGTFAGAKASNRRRPPKGHRYAGRASGQAQYELSVSRDRTSWPRLAPVPCADGGFSLRVMTARAS